MDDFARTPIPSWLAGVRQQPDPVHRPVAEAAPHVRRYAEWYVWTRRNVADAHRCHRAAQVAVAAVLEGLDPLTAASRAREAALAPSDGLPLRADWRTQTYAAWLSWATLEEGLEGDLAHRAAHAGLMAHERGLRTAACVRAAREAAGRLDAAPAPPAMVYDRAARAVAAALLCMVLLLWIPLPTPIQAGLAVGAAGYAGLGVVTSARRRLATVALGLSALALLLALVRLAT